jgi:hypothetical protein
MCHDFYGELTPVSKGLLIGAAEELKSDNDTPRIVAQKAADYYNCTLASEQDEIFDFIEDSWSLIIKNIDYSEEQYAEF